MNKNWLVLATLGLSLVATPYLACSNSGDAEASYSEADMKSAVLGRWEGTADIDGESVDFSLVLEQTSVKSKPGATTLAVSGTITSVNPVLNGNVDGEISAGKDLDPADVSLRVEDGTLLGGALEKQALNDGHVTKARPVGTFSLSRP
jgi:hypothetical protein